MKLTHLTLLIALGILLFVAVAPVAAVSRMPTGGCPVGFDERHEFHHHEEMFHEHHIGLRFDLNDNGFICVKHLANGLHVHADDVVR
jgi:hypothetical protein